MYIVEVVTKISIDQGSIIVETAQLHFLDGKLVEITKTENKE